MESMEDFMDSIRRKIIRKLAPHRDKEFDIDFSSLDDTTHVTDEEDMREYIETAREEGLRRIELRAIVIEVGVEMRAIVIEVCVEMRAMVVEVCVKLRVMVLEVSVELRAMVVKVCV